MCVVDSRKATSLQSIRSRLRHDLTVALKARDRVAVAALRSVRAAIDNAEAVDVNPLARRDTSSGHIAGATAGVGSSDVERRELSDADVSAIVGGQVEERSQAADEYEKLERDDVADRLRREAAILSAYLPGTV
ncbi:MAG: GatB/YqeY domain-containing protein [Solirubrobacteraceae bacterium]